MWWQKSGPAWANIGRKHPLLGCLIKNAQCSPQQVGGRQLDLGSACFQESGGRNEVQSLKSVLFDKKSIYKVS